MPTRCARACASAIIALVVSAFVITPCSGSSGLLREGSSTGFPIPRFVSLKADRANVRRGPSMQHQIKWVFSRKGLPVEVIAESGNWRRIRDSGGAVGWIYHSLLSGVRTVEVAPWLERTAALPLFRSRSPARDIVARIQAGVIANVEHCDGTWCEISVRGYSGFVQQQLVWGAYPGEKVP